LQSNGLISIIIITISIHDTCVVVASRLRLKAACPRLGSTLRAAPHFPRPANWCLLIGDAKGDGGTASKLRPKAACECRRLGSALRAALPHFPRAPTIASICFLIGEARVGVPAHGDGGPRGDLADVLVSPFADVFVPHEQCAPCSAADTHIMPAAGHIISDLKF
jgi:hypothetical protein